MIKYKYPRLTREQKMQTKISEKDRDEIFRLYNTGTSKTELSKMFSVHYSTIWRMLKGEEFLKEFYKQKWNYAKKMGYKIPNNQAYKHRKRKIDIHGEAYINWRNETNRLNYHKRIKSQEGKNLTKLFFSDSLFIDN
mgnify:CR=1 FL=1